MEYNSARNHLIFKEYGRNIQRMVEFASQIEDDEKRQKAVDEIINIMGQTNPHLRNIDDFKHKLWDHLFIMSDFKLKAESPFDLPDPEAAKFTKPAEVEYPSDKMKFRHYGKNVEKLIAKANDVEDAEKRMAFIQIIGSYMKMVYRNYNRENVSDEMIAEDIRMLSNGSIDLQEKMRFDSLINNLPKKKMDKRSHGGGGKGKKKFNKGKGGGGYRASSNNKGKFKKRPRR